jgi:hypothetical protein
MRRIGARGMGILLLPMTLLVSGVACAQIYKWTDADGKVHFGDKPHDPAAARAAQPVELQQGYQPAARTAQEQEAYDAEQRNNMLRDQVRRREEQQAQEKARAQHREEQAKICAGYADAIEELSTVEVENGVRHLVYIKGEDGKPVSSDRQREIVEELKAKMADAGCT